MGCLNPLFKKVVTIYFILTSLTYATMDGVIVFSQTTSTVGIPNTTSISGFDNFRNYRDSGNILSLKTADFLSFQYTGSETEMGEAVEIFELITEDYFHFFNVTMTINHHAVTNTWGEFNFSIKQVIQSGSSRFANRKICFFSVGDYEATKPGFCMAGARINSSFLETNIVNEIISRNEILTFSAFRQENEVRFVIKNNNSILINDTIISEDLKLVNCIELAVFTGTENCNFNIIAYEIKGLFSIASVLPSMITSTNLGNTNEFLILFISFLFLGTFQVCFHKLKKKKNFLI